jgi:Domain of unknown function (DUF4129)
MIEDISPEQVRRVTEIVLSEPEFQKSINLWDLAFNAFRDFLAGISKWAFENPDMARTLMIILGVVLAMLLAHIAYTVIREFASIRRNEDSRFSSARPLQALEGIASNWADAFQLAKAALEDGDLYRALWITHRVLLSAMDRMDLLRFARWKTNRDYLRECRADHAASKTLADVSDAYESVVYAHHEIHHDQALSLLSRVEAVVQEASQ